MRLTPRSIEKPDDWLSLWLAICALLGGGLGGLVWAVTQQGGWGVALGSGVAALLALPGVASPAFARARAREWNRIARGLSRRLARAVVFIAFHFVIRPASWAGADMRRAGFAEEPGWTDRAPDGAAAGGFLRWAVRRQGAWVAFLMPFLALLRAFDARAEGPPPAGIYTLF